MKTYIIYRDVECTYKCPATLTKISALLSTALMGRRTQRRTNSIHAPTQIKSLRELLCIRSLSAASHPQRIGQHTYFRWNSEHLTAIFTSLIIYLLILLVKKHLHLTMKLEKEKINHTIKFFNRNARMNYEKNPNF